MQKEGKIKRIILRGTLIFIGVILTGCSSFPIHAPAYYAKNLYKRLPYKQEGRWRVTDIFYATTRRIKGRTDLPSSFRADIAEDLTVGKLTIKIDPAIKIGKLEPGRLKRKGIVGIQKIGVLEEDAFIKELTDTVNSSPHNSLLVLVFGYMDNFESRAIKAAYFTYSLDVNTPVLIFDWPANQPVSIAGYLKARSFAKASGPYLGRVLAKVIREVKPKKLWVQAASLGSQVVCDGFDEMYKYADLSDQETEIDHVVLAAPDVGQDEFDAQFKNELAAFSRKLTAYVSSNDEALFMSSLINREKRLGRQEELKLKKEHEEFEETKDLLYLKSLEPDRISIVDVTPINKSTNRHGYYLENPEFFDDFYMRIFDRDAHLNRRLYLIKYEGNIDYWLLRGD